MLHSIIRQHPDVSGFEGTGVTEDEGQHLQSIIPTARAFGGPGRFCTDSNARMDETHELCSETTAEALFNQWKPYWDCSRKLLVEKSPPEPDSHPIPTGTFPGSPFPDYTAPPDCSCLRNTQIFRQKQEKNRELDGSLIRGLQNPSS